MTFMQIVEYTTTRRDEMEALGKEWEADAQSHSAGRTITVADRDRPNTYMTIVEFPSYEEAMENSNRPETAAYAEKMMALCEGEVTFRNLDVIG